MSVRRALLHMPKALHSTDLNLVHEVAPHRLDASADSMLCRVQIRSVEDVLSLGQSVEVLFLGRDPRGHVRLSRKALLQRKEPA